MHLICLGIESTAHTFGAALVESDDQTLRIISDKKDVYKAPEGAGIHPREASRHHVETSAKVIGDVIHDSRIAMDDVDFISYSAGPGLGPCLRVGAVVARSLASYYRKTLVPANHAVGHIELGRRLLGLRDPLVLLISGGHTVIAAKGYRGWSIYGETLDLTLGQLVDQLGRYFGLSSPAGPQIERLAKSVKSFDRILELPYVIKGNDVSYSGLLSAAKEIYAKGETRESVAHSVQEFAFSILIEATERALAYTDKQELLVTGGVAANQRLANMLNSMCSFRGVRLGVISKEYAGDCGAQIAAAGFLFNKMGMMVKPENAFIKQSWRIDQLDI